MRSSVRILPFVLLFAVSCAAHGVRAEEATSTAEPSITESDRRFWSFLPRERTALPSFVDIDEQRWLRSPIDGFILAKLKRADLHPAREADRAVLARRLAFDLLGLPPAPDDVRDFVADQRPDAFERLVDRWLADPRHGEHWAQHWLDVVRFGETEGFEYDNHRPGAWRYRDYVIDSLNGDKPFDQFAREQLAGDEAAAPDDASLAAVGFYRLGPVRRNAGNSDVAFSRNEVLTEMTDSVGTVFLGLTVGCARCHDHKFDPIRQKDYYRLQAFLAAAHEHDVKLADPETTRRWTDETAKIKDEMQKIREAMQNAEGQERDRLVEKLKLAESRLPPPLATISSVQNNSQQRTAIHVLFRGEADKKRDAVGPRALGVLVASTQNELPADVAQPKSRLADWLLAPENPLTARVLVNRLWGNHFGQGIVATPNDFGANGAPPSHRELLDYLANQLIDNGWSMKRLHREMVTSSVYRQSSRVPNSPRTDATDPRNQLLWKFSRRRLSAESLRDSLLAVSGELHSQLGGESVLLPVEKELVALLYKPAQWEVTPDVRQHARRSIYLLAKRNLRVPFLEVFDQPDLQSSCGRRAASTHAPQALELLNGDFANDMAGYFSGRLLREAGLDANQQIALAFQLVAGRTPTAAEQSLARRFLSEHSLREFSLAMFNLHAFLYVE